ncbi:MAG: DsbA family protein [Verrucomicrobiota bacterium]
MVKITYYLDVVSSWCYYFEPVWESLAETFGDKLEREWEITLIPEEGLPESAEEEDSYYRRSGIITRQQQMLNSSWVDPSLKEYLAPNLVSLACRALGVTGDTVRLEIARGAMVDGLKVGDWEVSAEIAAKASGLTSEMILKKARSPEIERIARSSTARFNAFGVNQRPAFFLESEIEDRAIFSGLIQAEPLVATINAMISDAEAYRSWSAHQS